MSLFSSQLKIFCGCMSAKGNLAVNLIYGEMVKNHIILVVGGENTGICFEHE